MPCQGAKTSVILLIMHCFFTSNYWEMTCCYCIVVSLKDEKFVVKVQNGCSVRVMCVET